MLNLPEVTQLQKPLPKAQIYRKFQLTNAQQTKFDADISRIDIVNEVSSRTIPSIQEGEKVKSFYEVSRFQILLTTMLLTGPLPLIKTKFSTYSSLQKQREALKICSSARLNITKLNVQRSCST